MAIKVVGRRPIRPTPMLSNLPLFAPRPLARCCDPRTSQAAAESMVVIAGQHRARIMSYLARGGTWTKDDLAAATGLTDVQCARRVSELVDAGLIVDSGETRPTATGRQATCWRAR